MISIVVPLFNQLSYTVECFNSLFAHTESSHYELIVIDNGSTDETPEYLETIPVEKKIITNRENLGVAPAWNQGVRASERDYVCIINNDVLFPPRWLSSFQAAFEAHKDVGAWYPRAIRGNKLEWSKVKCFVSDLPMDARPFSIKVPHERVLPVEFEDEDDRGNLGYFQIYKRSVFGRVGLFDEQFRMFCREDIDYFMRLERHGVEKRQLRNVIVFHYEAATLKTIDQTDIDHTIQENFDKFLQKWGFL